MEKILQLQKRELDRGTEIKSAVCRASCCTLPNIGAAKAKSHTMDMVGWLQQKP